MKRDYHPTVFAPSGFLAIRPKFGKAECFSRSQARSRHQMLFASPVDNGRSWCVTDCSAGRLAWPTGSFPDCTARRYQSDRSSSHLGDHPCPAKRRQSSPTARKQLYLVRHIADTSDAVDWYSADASLTMKRMSARVLQMQNGRGGFVTSRCTAVNKTGPDLVPDGLHSYRMPRRRLGIEQRQLGVLPT